MNKKHRDLELANSAFNVMETNYHEKWKRLERLYESKHDADFIKAAKELERSHIFVPVAKSTLDILDAIFTEAFFSAGNPLEITKNEDDESEIASCLNTLATHYYKKSKPYISLSMAFSSASRFGVGAVLPYWDSVKEMPVTRFVPATKIAFDTDALTRDEIQYTAYRFKQTKQDIKKKVETKFYPKIKKRDLGSLLGSRYNDAKERYARVDVTEIYTLNTLGKYICKTFIKNRLVREKEFSSNPIKYGYLVAVLPKIDESLQDNQSAGVGESMLENIKPIQKEINQKRNQIIDIHEQLIDPYTMVGDGADIDPEDAGRIKGVVNVGDPSHVKRFPPTNTFPLEKELAASEKDLDDITAINGMQRGQTSSSDRRAASAMAIINANSSSRLSKMATTINDTLFQDWAEAFVNDIYVNTPDSVIEELYGSNPLGPLGTRQQIDYVVNVNFGKTISKDVKVSELTMVLQMLNGREDADVMPILKELLKLILGDAFDASTIFTRVLGDGGDANTPSYLQGEERGNQGVGSESITEAAKRGFIPTSAGAGDTNGAEYIAATQNQI